LNYDTGDPDEPGVEAGLYTMKEEKIPGSTYDVPGCTDEDTGDCETVVTLPDSGEKYTIVVDSIGTGSFTLDIDRIRATSTVETVEWSGVPVTPLSVATTTFTSSANVKASTTSIAASAAPVSLDLDGDGAVDSVIKPGKVKDAAPRLDFMRSSLNGFAGHIGHIRFKDLKPVEKILFKVFIDAFIKRFGRS